jgi:hypothetical protein
MSLQIFVVAMGAFFQAQAMEQPPTPPALYRPIDDSIPRQGVRTIVMLGDRMLLQRTGQFEDCVVPLFDEERRANLGMARVTVRRGVPLCKRTEAERNLIPPYPNWNVGMSSEATYDFVLRDRDGGRQLCLRVMGVTSTCFAARPPADYQIGPYFVTAPNAAQQSIEYSGRTGSTLRFTYSESVGGVARDAFTREFQMDISQGNTVAFRGAIIEVEEASNTSITYRVVRNFQQDR